MLTKMIDISTRSYHSHKQRNWQSQNQTSYRDGVYFQDVLEKVLKNSSNKGDVEVLERLESIYGKKKRISDISSKDQQLYALIDEMANVRGISIKNYLQSLGYVYGNSYSFY